MPVALSSGEVKKSENGENVVRFGSKKWDFGKFYIPKNKISLYWRNKSYLKFN